jgi:predicted dehydrogenase
MRFLVVGCGSIGKRHIRNLKSIGCTDIVAFDVKEERLKEVRDLGAQTFNDLDKALDQNVNAVLICSPPIFHLQNTLKAVKKGCHVFIEKPIAHTLDGLDELINLAKDKNLITMVGFNLRFDKGLLIVKKLLDEGAIGKVITSINIAGQYLPDQHPWEDYRHGYAANQSLGGGIILDGMHELDFISWFLGDIREICCFGGKLSSLEMDTEDTAAFLLKFSSNAVGTMEMDYVKRAYERTCELIGENGTIKWDFKEHAVKCYSTEKNEWITYSYDAGYDINEMYVEEMKCFIKCITEHESPPVDALEGQKVLKVALAAKESLKEKKVIKL